jgi:hypothetical protein
MKNILTTILVLFALVVNAQSVTRTKIEAGDTIHAKNIISSHGVFGITYNYGDTIYKFDGEDWIDITTTKCDCQYYSDKTMYHYYVVYNHFNGQSFGSGSWHYILNKKIDDEDTTKNIVCCIQTTMKYETVVLTNWILLKTTKPKN